jgi:hypothetical protein
MPILNRQPEASHASGLLIVLGFVLAVAAIRNLPFFLHEVLGIAVKAW